MDSGNNSSGSLQSSSGGDDEYDSRAESSSLSAFLNNPPPPQPPPPSNHVFSLGPFTTSTTHMLDPLSNYLDPTQRSPPSLLNLDMMWSKPVRSEPNPTHLGGLIPCSSSSSPAPHNQQAFLSTQFSPSQTRTVSTSAFLTLPPESSLLSVSAATTNNDQPHNTNTNNISNVVRNPRKRSRASRRAPTTVLTTDTTNFRAMVQEFTGIPAPPFTSSPFPRTRLDLFAPVSAAATRSTTTLLDPPYLLRPSAQKLQQQHHLFHPLPPPSSSSMVDTLLASNNSTNSATNNSTSINYQQLSSSSSSADDHLGLLKQPPPNFNNMHNTNTILSFQNIFQAPPPKYPLANSSSSSSSSILASKTQQQHTSLEIPPPISGADSHLKMGVLEQLGLRHPHVNNTNVSGLHHQNMVLSPSVGALSSGNNNLTTNASSTEWAQRMGTITNNNGAVNYSNVAERVTNGKVHYSSASSSNHFHGEKGPECTTVVAARSEGIVESWINCSSD